MAKKIRGIGCDVVNISRIQKIIVTYDKQVLSYLFSDTEYGLCNAQLSPAIWFAICFAGKEAVSKALGRGLGGMPCRNIEVLPFHEGAAQITLTDVALQRANKKNFVAWHLQWKLMENHIFVTVDAY
jgi:holo-[acyl-carrier protein] synthase